MIKLQSILSEMRIVSAPKNHLSKLEEIKVKVESKSTPIEEKQRLALEAAKLVLPIWEVYYKDNRLHLVIQVAEEYLNNPTKKNRKKAIGAAYNATYDTAVSAATAAAYTVAYAVFAAYTVTSANVASANVITDAVTDAVSYALEATKLFFKIE